MQEAANILALDVTALPTHLMDIDANLVTMTPANFQGFVVTDDPSLELLTPRLVALAAQRNLPGLYSFRLDVVLRELLC
jgi:putative tryptophan/tyrosine transport system substrate-binding protein